MKPNLRPIISLVSIAVLAAGTGLFAGLPPPKPAPPPTPVPVVIGPKSGPAPAGLTGYKFQPVYVIKFDAQGIAHGDDGQVVTREHVLDLLAAKTVDQKTVIHIQVPKGITDRDESIAAFERAHKVSRIFDLLNFDSILIALAP